MNKTIICSAAIAVLLAAEQIIVLVKDTEGRFSSNPLWGDGWGWALFNVDQTDTPVTKNYKTECLGCHIPARNDDWIYLSGYPVLTDKSAGQPE